MAEMKTIFKTVYKAIPFKKEIFSLIKKVGTPSETVYRHLHFNGSMKINVNNGRDFKMVHYGFQLENELFWNGLYGNWEKNSMKLWSALAKDCEVIFDIGANTGVYTMVAKTINPNSEVHAFEPFESIYDKLIHNAKMNDFEVNCNCSAISNYTGDAVIYTENKDFAYSVTVNKNLWVKDKEPIKLNIKTITLKDYIEQKNISRIDLMKIDVETHEPEVMEGFASYIEKFRPIILIEILNDEVALKVSKHFDPNEFSFYDIDEEVGIMKSDSLTYTNSFNYLIIPKEKEGLLEGIIN